MTKWTRADHILPSKEGYYLCYTKRCGICLRKFSPIDENRMVFWSNGREDKRVTHWMYLPDEPE